MQEFAAASADPFDEQGHDHRHCIKSALAQAAQVCKRREARLTRQRRRVLELMWTSHRPLGAYALLEELRREGLNAAPPTVYRALDFLMEHGLIHRIDSLNAYMGCSHPGEWHLGQFLICIACGNAAELNDPRIGRAIEESAAGLDFLVQRQTVEIGGLCARCRGNADVQ